MKKKLMTCTKCGWIHEAVSRKYAEEEIANFQKHIETITEEQYLNWYGGKPLSMSHFATCIKCEASYIHFRNTLKSDGPGYTAGSILDKSEK